MPDEYFELLRVIQVGKAHQLLEEHVQEEAAVLNEFFVGGFLEGKGERGEYGGREGNW